MGLFKKFIIIYCIIAGIYLVVKPYTSGNASHKDNKVKAGVLHPVEIVPTEKESVIEINNPQFFRVAWHNSRLGYSTFIIGKSESPFANEIPTNVGLFVNSPFAEAVGVILIQQIVTGNSGQKGAGQKSFIQSFSGKQKILYVDNSSDLNITFDLASYRFEIPSKSHIKIDLTGASLGDEVNLKVINQSTMTVLEEFVVSLEPGDDFYFYNVNKKNRYTLYTRNYTKQK